MIIDFETASAVSLADAGPYRYAEDPSTRVLCMAYAGNGIEGVWWPGDPFPPEVLAAALKPGGLKAHNAQFERAIWNGPLRRTMPGLPALGPEAFSCTMAAAARRGWPLGLDDIAKAAGLPVRKDPHGRKVMRVLAARPDGNPSPEEALALETYAAQDVRIEAMVAGLVGDLDPSERQVWLLDQRINDRGIGFDVEAALAIKAAVEAERREADRRLEALTGIDRATKAARIQAWLAERGVVLPDMRKETVAKALDRPDLPPEAREVLEIRADAAGAAVRKIDAALACVCADGRIRGALQYYGAAATGRWAGRLVQPQNLPRPTADVDPADFLTLDLDGIRARYGSVLAAAKDALRGLFVAGPRRVLRRADLSAIEARLLFWLAGQEDALEIYRNGGDIYCEMASAVFGRKITKADKFERFIGKTIILGCGYQMGPARFQATANAAGAGITLADAERYVNAYRSRWAAVPALWRALDRACTRAVLTPGRIYEAGPVAFRCVGSELRARLPSGRVLYWQGARIEEDKVIVKKHGTGGWQDVALFGGILAERVTQATARDVLVAAMHRCEQRGLPVVLTVHDEIVTEPEEDGPGLDALLECLVEAPKWAEGLPLAAEGEEGKRFGK